MLGPRWGGIACRHWSAPALRLTRLKPTRPRGEASGAQKDAVRGAAGGDRLRGRDRRAERDRDRETDRGPHGREAWDRLARCRSRLRGREPRPLCAEDPGCPSGRGLRRRMRSWCGHAQRPCRTLQGRPLKVCFLRPRGQACPALRRVRPSVSLACSGWTSERFQSRDLSKHGHGPNCASSGPQPGGSAHLSPRPQRRGQGRPRETGVRQIAESSTSPSDTGHVLLSSGMVSWGEAG